METIGQGCKFTKSLGNVGNDSDDLIFDQVPELSKGKLSKFKPDRLLWERTLGVPKDRKFVRVSAVSGDVDVLPFTNDFDTLHRAVSERVFMVKHEGEFKRAPRPKKGVFSRKMVNFRSKLSAYLPKTAPVSHMKFVNSYSGRKKSRYLAAYNELREGHSKLEADAKLKVFVKFEKTDHTSKKDPVPRVISPRDPKYNLRLGRYLKPLEHKLFKSIDRLFNHPTILKGYNAEKSAEILREKWEMFSDPVAVGLDASRFDQHVSLEALKWEHEVYASCFHGKHRDRIRKLLSLQEYNHCYGETPDGKLEYRIKGTRMSGDMNTSMGNCLLMCAMNYEYALSRGVRISLANNGDDCVVFMERADLSRYMNGLADWFLALGFNMAVEEPVDEFSALEFCQTKPIFDGHRYIMCRNPWTGIVKDSVMLNCWQGPNLFRGWLDAVGTGGLALAGSLPIFSEFYSAYVRAGMKRRIPQELLPWSFRSLLRGVNRGHGPVTAEARSSFYTAFGYTPDEQLSLEDYYRKLVISAEPGAYQVRPIFSELV